MEFRLIGKDIRKSFGRLLVFDSINFELINGSSLAIAGKNGSGKSTLVKIIAGLLSPSSGEVIYQVDGREIDKLDWFKFVGFVAPYLQLYDEFTGYENLEILAKIRGLKSYEAKIKNVLERVNLYSRRDDLVRGYSSGMKQRLKYACALLHDPIVLILDEPTSNLDSEGVEMVWAIAEEQKKNGILIVATNEPEELKMCDEVINLDELKLKMKRQIVK
ncbi:heme exporter protein A [Candidatus Kryptonium thompsonii]|uniref:Heme exporter protein A n=1 Tax=Candidatus Kryptonium thompsonii TaxID=1633631 RepID=A0A0N7MS25_9BACT|nr:ABC transporter ATP-binding protein [Candidatus Kryptonium thompsoni]CUS76988.1 heme exporter protein A [Candidatus Kryptonium thompsoni]CUS79781.1 heme exporter protein A [Candidatus Kryptonium thompsoni]CUS81697.1 heme exporter protein A [Candidatus Kryptonium thompsoni]CUS86259.1 heme exporter protein A [Candidatus Kryptonium thompsoni]CUS90149.1 heme exporter protein A [Candidatus Kryptonium thompsoni]